MPRITLYKKQFHIDKIKKNTSIVTKKGYICSVVDRIVSVEGWLM